MKNAFFDVFLKSGGTGFVCLFVDFCLFVCLFVSVRICFVDNFYD